MILPQPPTELPSYIKVAAFDIKVYAWDHRSAAAANRFGEFSCNEQCIRIDTSISRFKTVDTLFHEINHAIYWAYGLEDSDKEERIVGTFATAWVQVIRDAPGLIPFIQELLFGLTPP